ncbi:hypothetical protein MWU77_22025 [Rhodococcus sp. F64268]|uniref:hypothetical protein n=1 Tax=Rhodococcus sp. F64268 TaxID=2926402 RepID=UPI001FF4474A|nr:hypothetical protein [Rhodococcus sp. F64268]MCK0093460.1 hypothetical protein [Rhodococcus sp. F64268]
MNSQRTRHRCLGPKTGAVRHEIFIKSSSDAHRIYVAPNEDEGTQHFRGICPGSPAKERL